MRASELRWEIQIQSATSDSDLAGGWENLTWSTDATVRAKIEPIAGSVSYEEGQERGNRAYLITIRYPQSYSITYSSRILWGSKILTPNVVLNPDNMEHWATFEANEVSNG